MAIATKTLKNKLLEHFGLKSFRPGQVEAVKSAIEGNDTIVVMPTGAGKSLCFQLPGLALEGLTVVVSPLVALMKDQADKLRQSNIRVAVMNSSIPAQELAASEVSIRKRTVDFVYTTPERLTDSAFRELLRSQVIDLFVVDEAHCISQWGHDFRPDYLELHHAIDALGRPPVLALTATATSAVLADIQKHLAMQEPEIISTGFLRPNLHLRVESLNPDDQKVSTIRSLLNERQGPGIIYASTVKQVETLSGELHAQGLKNEYYHGKLSTKRRRDTQDRFMNGDLNLIVATNAFGLGIDKSNIRYVIHYNAPGSLESLYQETGRAGRDGEPAEGILLYAAEDLTLQKFFTSVSAPPSDQLMAAYRALSALAGARAVPFTELAGATSLTKAALRSSLTVLMSERYVAKDSCNRYTLTQSLASIENFDAAAEMYRQRREHAQWKLEQVKEYAERRMCRWKVLLKYFGSDDLSESETCQTCDNCLAAQ